MSSQAMSWAWKQTIPALPPLPKTESGGVLARVSPAIVKNVLLALAEHANPEGHCFPSWKRIAEMVGCSRATVHRALRDLEDAGLVKKSSRFRENGGQTSSEYYLPIRQRSTTAPSHSETHPPSPADTAPPSLTDTPPRSHSETPAVSAKDPAPSLPDTPITKDKEPRTKNTTSNGGGVLNIEKLKGELAERGYVPEVIGYAIEELNRTASDQKVDFPLRYCIAAADRRAKEIASAESRAASIERNGRRLDEFDLDEGASEFEQAIASLSEEEQKALREQARAQLPPIAKELEPALHAQMRQIFRDRQTEEIET